MVVTLDEVKDFLRLDSSHEDDLITGFITAAEDIVEGILRFSISDYGESIPEVVKQAIYYSVSKFYEDRNELNMDEMIAVLKALLFTKRKVDW